MDDRLRNWHPDEREVEEILAELRPIILAFAGVAPAPPAGGGEVLGGRGAGPPPGLPPDAALGHEGPSGAAVCDGEDGRPAKPVTLSRVLTPEQI